MGNIHQVLYAIVNLHVESGTVWSLPPVMLNNIGKFMETLHRIYLFIEAQHEGNKIKHLFRNNEMNRLLKECDEGLAQARECFSVQTQTETLNDIRDFKKTVDLMHKELMDLIEKLSDTSTLSERASVYLGVNESRNSSNSFSILPSKPKIFHGRKHELDSILMLLTQQSPKIAILGGGGMGKTSLAKAVLHHPDTTSKFENRFFVSAEAATTSVELAALIGLHVGLNPGHNLTKSVVQYFSRRTSCLLILDNLETVWEPIQSRSGVEEFLSQLTGLEHLALLITMRGAERPAKVRWSHPFLPPLQPLSDDAARQTFIDITDNSNAIEEINQLLGFTDNMPLAIDLIAHLAEYEGFSNVLLRWKTEKTALLSVGFDRQSSLDASIGLSLSSPRITPDSKELLSLLSILPNGLSEAELVQGDLGIPNILSSKAVLQAISLAYWDSNQRLMLLMPIREYIQRILPPSLACIDRIRQYYYVLVELSRKYRGEQLQPVVKQITSNLANLHDILQQGLHPQAPSLADTIHCALALNRFYRVTGREHFPLLDDVQCLLSQLCDHQLETIFLTELLFTQHYWPVSEQMMAQAMIYLEQTNDHVLGAKFYQAVGEYLFYYKEETQQGTQFLKKALKMSELCGDRTQECNVLLSLGGFEEHTGNYRAGSAYATAAQRLSKLSVNLYQEALATHLGAACSSALGDYQQGAAQLHRATELLHLCGMSAGSVAHQIRLIQANVHLSKSEYTEAKNVLCQVIKSTSAEDNYLAHVIALLSSAFIGTIIGEAEENIHHEFKVAQEILRRQGSRGLILPAIVQAMIEFRAGRFDIAKVKFQECLHLSWAKSSDDQSLSLQQLANIKAWPVNEQQHKWTIIYLGFAHKSKQKLAFYKALLFLGDIFIMNGDEDTAANLYQVALTGFTEMDVHHSRGQCMLRLGDLANTHGNTSEAIAFWKTARPLFEQSVAKDVCLIESRLASADSVHVL
ncbi:hypothetical protein K438DRAFT_756503 [Mycena galopus ATCC 62051]|nr:hypothetical protein K438DRAFT_756503 [Mycena galopus ATCC 62051]